MDIHDRGVQPALNLSMGDKIKSAFASKEKALFIKVLSLQQHASDQAGTLSKLGFQLRTGQDITVPLSDAKSTIGALTKKKEELSALAAKLPVSSQQEESFKEIQSLETQIKSLSMHADRLEQLSGDASFTHATKIKNAIISYCSKVSSNPKSALKTLVALTSLKQIIRPISYETHSIIVECGQILDKTLKKFPYASASDQLEILKHYCEELIGGQPQKPAATAPKTNLAVNIAADAKFKKIGLFLHANIKASVKETEKIASKILEIKQKLDMQLKDGTANTQTGDVENLKQSINDLTGKLQDQKNYLSNRTRSTVGNAAQQFIQKWEEEIQSIKQKIGLLEAVSQETYINFGKSVAEGFALLATAQRESAKNIPKSALSFLKAQNICNELRKSLNTLKDPIQEEFLTKKLNSLHTTLQQHNFANVSFQGQQAFSELLVHPGVISGKMKDRAHDCLAKHIVNELKKTPLPPPDIAILRAIAIVKSTTENTDLQKLIETYTTKIASPICAEAAELCNNIQNNLQALHQVKDDMRGIYSIFKKSQVDEQTGIYENILKDLQKLESLCKNNENTALHEPLRNALQLMQGERYNLIVDPHALRLSPRNARLLDSILQSKHSAKADKDTEQVTVIAETLLLQATLMRDKAKDQFIEFLSKIDPSMRNTLLNTLKEKTPLLLTSFVCSFHSNPDQLKAEIEDLAVLANSANTPHEQLALQMKSNDLYSQIFAQLPTVMRSLITPGMIGLSVLDVSSQNILIKTIKEKAPQEFTSFIREHCQTQDEVNAIKDIVLKAKSATTPSAQLSLWEKANALYAQILSKLPTGMRSAVTPEMFGFPDLQAPLGRFLSTWSHIQLIDIVQNQPETVFPLTPLACANLKPEDAITHLQALNKNLMTLQNHKQESIAKASKSFLIQTKEETAAVADKLDADPEKKMGLLLNSWKKALIDLSPDYHAKSEDYIPVLQGILARVKALGRIDDPEVKMLLNMQKLLEISPKQGPEKTDSQYPIEIEKYNAKILEKSMLKFGELHGNITQKIYEIEQLLLQPLPTNIRQPATETLALLKQVAARFNEHANLTDLDNEFIESLREKKQAFDLRAKYTTHYKTIRSDTKLQSCCSILTVGNNTLFQQLENTLNQLRQALVNEKNKTSEMETNLQQITNFMTSTVELLVKELLQLAPLDSERRPELLRTYALIRTVNAQE